MWFGGWVWSRMFQFYRSFAARGTGKVRVSLFLVCSTLEMILSLWAPSILRLLFQTGLLLKWHLPKRREDWFLCRNHGPVGYKNFRRERGNGRGEERRQRRERRTSQSGRKRRERKQRGGVKGRGGEAFLAGRWRLCSIITLTAKHGDQITGKGGCTEGIGQWLSC